MRFGSIVVGRQIEIVLSSETYREVQELAIVVCGPDSLRRFYPRTGVQKRGPLLLLGPTCPLHAMVSPASGRLFLCRPSLNLWFDLAEWGDVRPLLWPEDAPTKERFNGI